MVWEQRVLLIVMTTRLVEQGRTKCGRYWPLELGAETRHGFFTVENLGVTQHDCYSVSQLLVTDTRTEQTREVRRKCERSGAAGGRSGIRAKGETRCD